MEKNTVILGIDEYNEMLNKSNRYEEIKKTKALKEVQLELVQKYLDTIHSNDTWTEIKFEDFTGNTD